MYQPHESLPMTAKEDLNSEEINHLSMVFDKSGGSEKDVLSREDLKVAVITLFGYKPVKWEIEELFAGVRKKYGQNQKGMPLEHFISVMGIKLKAVDLDEQIRQTFVAFDHQCRGFLSLDDLKKAASVVAPHLMPYTLSSVFQEVDRDGDGRISYKDFEFMMKYNT